jgi:hypothetical protein
VERLGEKLYLLVHLGYTGRGFISNMQEIFTEKTTAQKTLSMKKNNKKYRAKILPLEGKYYGTNINIETPEGETKIQIWFMGSWEPSKRQLEYDSVPLMGWREELFYCDSHYETKDCYDLAKTICESLNGKIT